MKKKTTLFELEPKKLAKILYVCSEAQNDEKEIRQGSQ